MFICKAPEGLQIGSGKMLKETVMVQFKVPGTYNLIMTLLKLFYLKHPQEAQKDFCQASLGSDKIS